MSEQSDKDFVLATKKFREGDGTDLNKLLREMYPPSDSLLIEQLEQREAALMVQNNELKVFVNELRSCVKDVIDLGAVKAVLVVTPEQSLSAHNKRIRDKAIESAASFIESFFTVDGDFFKLHVNVNDAAKAIRDLKENSHE